MKKHRMNVSHILVEEWTECVPADPYSASYLIGRETNCVDWLHLRASLNGCADGDVDTAEKVLARLMSHARPWFLSEVLREAVEDCLPDWHKWHRSEDYRNWSDWLADYQEFDTRSWDGWPTQGLRYRCKDGFDPRYQTELDAAFHLGRTVDQGIRSFAFPWSLQLLCNPDSIPRHLNLGQLWSADVRDLAQTLRIDLPDITQESQFDAVEVVDRHVRPELARLHREHQAKRGSDPLKPHWDAASKRLFLAGKVAKAFRNAASNQIRVLEHFNLEDWPLSIDDPLPPKGGVDPKRRLNETIKSLNERLILMRFSGDGTGTRIEWHVVG